MYMYMYIRYTKDAAGDQCGGGGGLRGRVWYIAMCNYITYRYIIVYYIILSYVIILCILYSM